MQHISGLLSAGLGCLLASASLARATTIDTVLIGNPGNVGDTLVVNDGSSGYGSVAYEYRIGKYEVTNSQYTDFLNAKDSTGANTLALYNSGMTDSPLGGINYTAANGNGAKYTVKSGHGDNPVNYVNWYDAARFTNWLNNGQGNGNTEDGAYQLSGGTPTPSNGATVARSSSATWFLPNENEWYKAAYFDPRNLDQGGPASNAHYWLNPTKNDSLPTSIPAPGTGAPIVSNTVNYYIDDGLANGYNGGLATTNSIIYDPLANYLTNVGAYTQSTSFYGTFDQAGNVVEWNDTSFLGGTKRGEWGGSYLSPDYELSAFYRNYGNPGFIFGGDNVGFRVATSDISNVPEPSSFLLAACGLMGWILCRRSTRTGWQVLAAIFLSPKITAIATDVRAVTILWSSVGERHVA